MTPNDYAALVVLTIIGLWAAVLLIDARRRDHRTATEGDPNA